MAAHTYTHRSRRAVVSLDLQNKTSWALQPASGCHMRLGDCCLELFWCCSHVIYITHPPVMSCSQHVSCVRTYVFICVCEGLSPWCPIIPNNHPIVMREMRFPLNNSRPARLADPQPLRLRQNKHSRVHANTHTQLSACINSDTCTFKYTHTASTAQLPSGQWWWHSLFVLLLI